MTPKLVNSLGFKCKIDKLVYKSYSSNTHMHLSIKGISLPKKEKYDHVAKKN